MEVMLVRFCLYVFCLVAMVQLKTLAQLPAKTYTIRNGRMYIELSRKIDTLSLDSFIARYNLYDLPLKQAIKSNSMNSLIKLGWKQEINNNELFVISKPLFGVSNINNPADKIIFAEKHPTIEELFPAEREGLLYGYNRFRNKLSFAVNGSTVTFFLRKNTEATHVMLAGSFNSWSLNALAMTKTDSGWIAPVKLKPGKYWYKFIINGNWNIDNDNMLHENDGMGNENSVFYKTNYLFRLCGFDNAKKTFVSGSFNNWRPVELQMLKTQGGWELPLYLAEGTHTYKFIADGEWIADPKNENRLPDGQSGFNSVIRIGKPHLFNLNGYTNATQVVLTGSFNKWRKDELFMNRTGMGWELPYTLGAGNYEYRFIIDGKQINDPLNPLITNNKNNKGNSFLIIDPNFRFRLKGFTNAKAVFLSGDFDNWSPYTLPMKHEGDEWTFNIHLSAGKHLYKFIVDGKWIIDPHNKLWEQNEYGTGNSVIWITN
jgi:Glycogen recognition site of AMP-activated protein kinase